MKKVPYNITEDSIVVVWDERPYTIRKDNANFRALRSALFEGNYDDVEQYLDIKKAVENFVDGAVEVKDDNIYYHGHALHGVVVDKLLEMLRSGMKDSSPMVKYIKRLMENPSSNSVEQLYTFLGYKSLPITPEGKVLGYKGVQTDFWSNTGNADTIVVQGETNDRHQIYNGVGETIEIQRRCVDDNKNNHCSFGLHVGSYDYANGWAGNDGKLLLVEFDPQDAVSVPTDCSFQKLRVNKYKVLADISDTRQELNKAVYEANKPIYGSNDDSGEEGEEGEEGDNWGDDENNYDDYNAEELNIRNYVENKHEVGEEPTLKQVQSRMKGTGLTCRDILNVLNDYNFMVESDEDKALSQQRVLIS
tara:strand:- start:1153 stop:2238 length:1086 start_codon:yes stop_codon:yes gene_type:complete